MSTVLKEKHTKACGVEPVDKSWGIGAQKNAVGGGFSPYERINRLREIYFETPLTIDSLRCVKITEAYKEYETMPPVVKKARTMEKCMEAMPLHYNEGELLLIDDGTDIMSSGVYPETTSWIFSDLKNAPLYERTYNPANYSDKIRDEILSCEEYWKGKTIPEKFAARLSEDAAKGCLTVGGNLVFDPSITVHLTAGHFTPNYPFALEKGIGGMKAYIREYMEKAGTPITIDQIRARQFHEAELIVLEAISNLFRRYSVFAKDKIKEYASQQTKDELQHLSEMCARLAEEPPQDFWDAIQMVHMIMQMTRIEQNGVAIAYGRADQYLYPFYKDSLEKGTYTKDFMQELIEFMYIKAVTNHFLVQDGGDTDFNRIGIKGWAAASLIVGGVDKDGNDATNDLSFMFLDAMVHTRLANPWLAVRWHENTPYEYKVKYANMVRLGIGHPKFLNDNTCMDALMRQGVSLEDARDYVNCGCVELDVPGKCLGYVDSSYFSIGKVFELAINNGSCIACGGENCPNYSKCKGAGKALGLETGYLKDFKTFDEVREAFEAQMKYWADRCIQALNIGQCAHAENDDQPFMSILIEGCTESGKTLNEGGAKYNFTGINALGPATAADSLTAIKQVIFEDKIATPEEFYDALINNWNGHERLYALVNSEKVRHYGNDDDEADAMMDYVIGYYADLFQSYPPTRGGVGIVRNGCFSQTLNLLFGSVVGATPDGRKAHEALSENIGAARTAGGARDFKGHTAYARSIGKVDHGRLASGALINMKFGPETVSGEQGLQNLIDFIDGYFAQGPLHIQFMVTNKETLIDAQKHPENYKDLLVRVSGFSSYFHTLSTNFQDELINRTEHTVD